MQRFRNDVVSCIVLGHVSISLIIPKNLTK